MRDLNLDELEMVYGAGGGCGSSPTPPSCSGSKGSNGSHKSKKSHKTKKSHKSKKTKRSHC